MSNPDFPDYKVEELFVKLRSTRNLLILVFISAVSVNLLLIELTDLQHIGIDEIFFQSFKKEIYQSLIDVNGILLGASLIAIFYIFERFGSAFKIATSRTQDRYHFLNDIDNILKDQKNVDTEFNNKTKRIKDRTKVHMQFLKDNRQQNNDKFIFCFGLIVTCFMLAILFLLIPLQSEKNGVINVIFSIVLTLSGLIVLYLIWKTFDSVDMINENEDKIHKDYFQDYERYRSSRT